jgi:hypothetical protein
MSENIFADEWVECLEAHYMHVIRTKDKVTEPSLSIVMHSAGFTDKQLAELRVRATMHVDDVGEDFVPDLDVLGMHNHDHQEAVPEANEAKVYNIPIDLAPAPVDDVQAVEVELSSESDHFPEVDPEPEELQEQEAETLVEDEIEQDDPDAPQQLSLF